MATLARRKFAQVTRLWWWLILTLLLCQLLQVAHSRSIGRSGSRGTKSGGSRSSSSKSSSSSSGKKAPPPKIHLAPPSTPLSTGRRAGIAGAAGFLAGASAARYHPRRYYSRERKTDNDPQADGDYIFDAFGLTSECEAMGFPGAKLNECGYCVGDATGLPEDYGKDCKGVCHGRAVKDCSGACEGEAYIDECTGECIGGSTEKDESSLENPNRDCRGVCLVDEPLYSNDACGICALNYSVGSSFLDCSQNCQTPGTMEKDAATEVCNTCIGGKADSKISDVLDECGRCIADGIPCPCNGTYEDACGVCNGKGESCLVLKGIWPLALPGKTEVKVTLMGAFKSSKDVQCLFVPEGDKPPIAFKGKLAEPNVTCKVSLPAGKYTVYAKLPTENSTDSGVTLLVYKTKEVVIDDDDMEPREASYIPDDKTNPFVKLVFSGKNLPDLPLICHVNGPDWPFPRKLYSAPDNPHSCLLPYPDKSMTIFIRPTFDKEISLSKKPIQFKFNSPAITVPYAYASDDGSTVQVIFDRPLDISKLETCDDILVSESIEVLGGNLECRWATKHQLSIYLTQALQEESIKIGIKPEVLKEDKQRNVVLNTDVLYFVAQQVPSTGSPMLVITGPTQVPQCGKFALVGHFTSPEGRASDFKWSVMIEEGDVGPELQALVQESQSSVLVLEASLMEVGPNYTFTLSTQAEPGSIIEASHNIIKLNYDAPIVTIYSSTLLLVKPISVDDIVELMSEVVVPDCITDVQAVNYVWSVNDPRVLFNMDDLVATTYVAKPYSLPPDSTITFTLTVFMGANYSTAATTNASVTISVAPLEMKAKILGGDEMIVGTDSGMVKLDGSESMDGRFPLVYQWTCFDEMQQPCYNHSALSNEDALLITRDMQRSAVLEINSTGLKPDSKLTIGLQVFNASDPSIKSDISTMILNVTNGSKPQLMLKSVYAREEEVKDRHESGAYLVPAGAPVMIYAHVIDSAPDTCNVDWKIEGFPYLFNTGKAGNEIETYISIDEGILVDHGVYVVTLEACCKSRCSQLKVSLNATPGVLLCQVLAYPYTALNWTHIVVDGCSVPLGRAPLTYQLFFHVKNRLLPITEPKFASMLNIIGPPVPSDAMATFSVEVCDKLDQCRMFNSNVVMVESAANDTESLLQIKRTAAQLHASGDSLAALSVLSVVFINEIVNTSQEEVDLAITYATTAIEKQELKPGQVAVLYAAMTFILEKGDAEIKRNALLIIEKATINSKGQRITLPVRILQEIYQATSEAFKQSPDDKDMAKQVKQTQGMIVEMAASQLPLGQKLELKTEGKARPLTQLHHGFLDKMLVGSDTNLGPVKAQIKFGPDLRKEFTKWQCESETPCQGAVAAVTLYPEHSPFPDDDVIRLTPIVSITLRAPGTGRKIIVKDVEKAVNIALTQISNKTVPEGQIARCHFWDEKKQTWSLDGLTTLGTSKGEITCYTTHLTSFTVLQIKNGLSAGTIAGIVVAILMGVTIFGVMIILFVRQKQQSTTTRVSNKVKTEPVR